jgi:hypothetical protein
MIGDLEQSIFANGMGNRIMDAVSTRTCTHKANSVSAAQCLLRSETH